MTQSALAYAPSTSTVSTASTTWYGPWNTEGALTQLETSEAPTQAIWRGGASTLTKMRVRASTNARSTDTLVKGRLNTADSALVVTITGGGGAGTYVDMTNSMALADGDLWNYSIATSTGTGSVGMSIAAEIQTAGQVSVPIATWGSLAFTAARFYMIGGGNFVSNITETPALALALETCTLKNLQVYIRGNSSTGFTFKTRVNGADGALTVSPGSAATGWFEDTTNTDSLAAGDTYCFTTTAPSATATLGYAGVKYTSATANTCAINSNIVANSPAAGATAYFAMGGAKTSAIEANCQHSMPFGGTISKLSARVFSNTSSTASTLISRINNSSASSTLTITIPSATTSGVIQDTTNSDSFAATDTLDIRFTGATTGPTTLQWVGALITASSVSAVRRLTLLGVG